MLAGQIRPTVAIYCPSLLACARRQSLDLRPNDINRLVVNMEDLLRRTLGEQVQLQSKLAADLWAAFTDANQLENAI